MFRLRCVILLMYFCLLITGCGGSSPPPEKDDTRLKPIPVKNLSVEDVSVDEGGTATLKVSLSEPSSEVITVDYITKDGSAQANTHYVAKSDTLTFAPGETEQLIEIETLVRESYQPDSKTMAVALTKVTGANLSNKSNATVTINPTLPSLSIADININKGETANLTVKLSRPSTQTLTVDYSTKDDTAMAGIDYTVASGTLSFDPGVIEQTIELTILPIGNLFDDKSFDVSLRNPTGANLGPSNAKIFIQFPFDLNVAFNKIKTFSFSWQDSPLAANYQLFEDPDGLSGFSPVGQKIEKNVDTIDHIVPLYARSNARYVLEICNDSNVCASSRPVYISERLSDLRGSIGFFKADTNRAGFAQSISLSADGQIMAVARSTLSRAWGFIWEGSDRKIVTEHGIYIFSRTVEKWKQQSFIPAKNPMERDLFGYDQSISLSGDGKTLAVGAMMEDGGLEDSGVVYVYTFLESTSKWYLQASLKSQDIIRIGKFGKAVSISNDGKTLAVSSWDKTPVHIFTREDSVWSLQDTVDHPSVESFGINLDLSGDGSTLSVGATGALYVYAREEGGWEQQEHFEFNKENLVNGLGWTFSQSLSDDGNTLAVGLGGESVNPITGKAEDSIFHPYYNYWYNPYYDSGAVFIYVRSESKWTQQSYIKPSIALRLNRFGYEVRLSGEGNVLAVGTNVPRPIDREEDQPEISRGKAYVFIRKNAEWSEQPYLKTPYTHGCEFDFGWNLGLSGDGKTLAVGAGDCTDATGVGVGNVVGESNPISDPFGAVYLY